jgi:hypothetical protein
LYLPSASDRAWRLYSEEAAEQILWHDALAASGFHPAMSLQNGYDEIVVDEGEFIQALGRDPEREAGQCSHKYRIIFKVRDRQI